MKEEKLRACLGWLLLELETPPSVGVVKERVPKLDGEKVIVHLYLSVWPHEVEPWFHSWYRARGRVEILDVKYNLAYINSTLCGYTNSSKRATYLNNVSHTLD